MFKKIFISVSVACIIFTAWVALVFLTTPKPDTSVYDILSDEVTALELGNPETPEQALGQSIALISIVSAWCAAEQPDPAIKAIASDTLNYVVRVGSLVSESNNLDSDAKNKISESAALFGDQIVELMNQGHSFTSGTCTVETFNRFNQLLKSVEYAATEKTLQSI